MSDRVSRAVLQISFDKAPTPFVLLREDGSALRANHAAAERFGLGDVHRPTLPPWIQEEVERQLSLTSEDTCSFEKVGPSGDVLRLVLHPFRGVDDEARWLLMVLTRRQSFLWASEAAIERWGLTGRETDVLEGVVGGGQNAEIAADLGLAESTVKAHVGRLMAKAGVRNRSTLIAAYFNLLHAAE